MTSGHTVTQCAQADDDCNGQCKTTHHNNNHDHDHNNNGRHQHQTNITMDNYDVGNSEDRADCGGSRINPHADTGADSDSAVRELENKKIMSQNSPELNEIQSKQCFEHISVNSGPFWLILFLFSS